MDITSSSPDKECDNYGVFGKMMDMIAKSFDLDYIIIGIVPMCGRLQIFLMTSFDLLTTDDRRSRSTQQPHEQSLLHELRRHPACSERRLHVCKFCALPLSRHSAEGMSALIYPLYHDESAAKNDECGDE